jgi:hypothetical protein
MLYKSGHLEVDPYVRSVPLGEKRKRGRPKKIPNCLVRSPVKNPAAPEARNDLSAPEPEVGNAPVQKTTRKRKRNEASDVIGLLDVPEGPPPPEDPEVFAHSDDPEVLSDNANDQQSPVSSLMNQIHHKPGLGASKPPKKRKKEATPGAAIKPAALACKKRKGSCNHEVVFGEHYNKSSWAEYAAFVKSKKSSIPIDPNYVS